MGVPTFKFKLWAFVIGAGIGGLSGALYAGQVQFVVPTNFNVINSVLFLSAVVLGGQGNKLGVILGAFIIVYLPNFFLGVHLFGVNLGDLKYLFFGLALMVLMIFRPQGLIPVRQKLLAYGKRARRSAARRRRFEGSRHDVRHNLIHEAARSLDRGAWPRCNVTVRRRRGRNPARNQGSDGQVRRADRPGRGDLHHQARRDPRPHRAERRRQDHLLQRDDRGVPADSGTVTFDGEPLGRPQAQPDHPARHRPDVPEHPAVRRDDRAGERRGRHRRPAPDVGARRDVPHAAAPARGARRPIEKAAGAAGVRRHRATGRREGPQPALRRPAPAGDRPGAGHRARSCCAWTSRPPGSTRPRRPR